MKQKSLIFLILMVLSNFLAYLMILMDLKADLFISQLTMLLIYSIIILIALFSYKKYKNSSLCFFGLFFGLNLINILILFIKEDVSSQILITVVYMTDVVGLMVSVLSLEKKKLVKPSCCVKKMVIPEPKTEKFIDISDLQLDIEKKIEKQKPKKVKKTIKKKTTKKKATRKKVTKKTAKRKTTKKKVAKKKTVKKKKTTKKKTTKKKVTRKKPVKKKTTKKKPKRKSKK